jgi:hypothetical protein
MKNIDKKNKTNSFRVPTGYGFGDPEIESWWG